MRDWFTWGAFFARLPKRGYQSLVNRKTGKLGPWLQEQKGLGLHDSKAIIRGGAKNFHPFLLLEMGGLRGAVHEPPLQNKTISTEISSLYLPAGDPGIVHIKHSRIALIERSRCFGHNTSSMFRTKTVLNYKTGGSRSAPTREIHLWRVWCSQGGDRWQFMTRARQSIVYGLGYPGWCGERSDDRV